MIRTQLEPGSALNRRDREAVVTALDGQTLAFGHLAVTLGGVGALPIPDAAARGLIGQSQDAPCDHIGDQLFGRQRRSGALVVAATRSAWLRHRAGCSGLSRPRRSSGRRVL
jgi:hypothetical protein